MMKLSIISVTSHMPQIRVSDAKYHERYRSTRSMLLESSLFSVEHKYTIRSNQTFAMNIVSILTRVR